MKLIELKNQIRKGTELTWGHKVDAYKVLGITPAGIVTEGPFVRGFNWWEESENFEITHQPEITLDNLIPGDELVGKFGGEGAVLEVGENTVLLSPFNEPDVAGEWYTFQELKEKGLTPKQPEGQGRWKPCDGETYWTTLGDGTTFSTIWVDHALSDKNRWELGNVFKTREEAEQEVERVKKALRGEGV